LVAVLLELGVPQGQVVSRWKGGEGILREALGRVKAASFTGYLKISLSKEGDRSEALLSFASGAPTFCLNVFQPYGMEEIWFLGDRATEYMFADAAQPEAVITLHGDVNLRDFEQLFPKARIKKLEAPRRPMPPAEIRQEKLRGEQGGGQRGADLLGSSATEDADRKKVDQQAKGVYDLILQYHKMRSNVTSGGTCERCGGPVDLLGYCPKCAPGEGEPPEVLIPRMDPRFTFDSFVVGSGSRFAEAAARAVAADPGYLYNPLFIHGRTGLGKTHLLQSIGHLLKGIDASLSVTYLPLESLDEEYLQSIGNRYEGPRQELEQTGLLLIDDLQYLSGKDRVQEELLKVINKLVPTGIQIVITADRAPREIPALLERLTSRVESGLVVDIGPLDHPSRLAILQRLASDAELEIPDDVMAFVAERCPDNVRQLEGGMNRVLAFASLMRSEITLDIAREVLGTEKAVPHVRKARLEAHRSYVVEESRPELTYELMAAKLDEGYRGLVFSRSNPNSVREKIPGRKAEIYWLTEHESKKVKTVPPSLEKIVMLSEEHMRLDGPSIVVLDDLHYLISNATFEGVVRFLRAMVDTVSERQAIFVVSISPESLRLQERSIIERELESVRP
jgi:chromosomal replication initiator protein DnaA